MRNTVVIDDCEPDRYLASRVMRRIFPEADLVELTNGREALDYFTSELANADRGEEGSSTSDVATGGAKHIVLLDINMPGLSGFDLLSQLQQLDPIQTQRLNQHYRFVMLSSSRSPTDLGTADAFPMVAGYLHKPVRREKIFELLSELN